MREIKFRAWLEGTHGVLTFHEPHMDYNVVLSAKGNWCDVESGWDIQGEYDTVPLMQYTGLKDKNEKEIYEGDLFQVNGNKIYIVKYIENSECEYEMVAATFALWFNEESFFPFDEYAYKYGQVIGNIYENPELLKQ